MPSPVRALGLVAVLVAASAVPAAASVEVGFARADLSPAVNDGVGFRRPLEARCAVFVHGGRKTALVAFDLGSFSVDFDADLRRRLARAIGARPDDVLVHATHTHDGPSGDNDDVATFSPALARAVTPALVKALADARPARVRSVFANVGKSLSLYRRADTGPDLGVQSFWYGYQLRGPDARADASAMVRDMKARWRHERPDYTPDATPVYFDGDVDPLVHALRFEGDDGRAIGTIVRFSAHPVLAHSVKHDDVLHDPDYPAFVRDAIEAQQGGVGMFLQGTSGNLALRERMSYEVDEKKRVAKKQDQLGYLGPSSAYSATDTTKMIGEMKRIGGAIADAALSALAKAPAHPIDRFSHRVRTFRAPLDPALPLTKQELERQRAPWLAEYEAALRVNAPLRELRRLANRLNWFEWAARGSFTALTVADKRRGWKDMPTSALEIGDTTLVFMPSEIMLETTFALRKVHGDALWTVSLTGGGLHYVPTAKMWDEGGYEARQAMGARETETKLVQHLLELLQAPSAAR